jgi:4-carboxymuconolactone decarboxylase
MNQPRVKPVVPGTRPELAELEARILKTRGQITPLYQMLLNSAPVVDGWEALLTGIRQKTSIPASLREMTILRIAVLNRAPYEFEAHVAHARKAGVSDAVIDQLRLKLAPDAIEGLDAGQRDALLLTDAMTRDIHVPDAIFDPVYKSLGETAVVELVATIAAYNMVSRFLVALHIDH